MQLVPAKQIEEVDCEEIDIASENPKSINTLADNLINFMVEKEAQGLSAIQVGINKRVFVYRNKNDENVIVINPKIYPNEKASVTYIEACLSYPNKVYSVKRFKSIIANYYTIENNNFVPVRKILKKEEAIVFQHETDHVRGVTISMKGKEVKTKEE